MKKYRINDYDICSYQELNSTNKEAYNILEKIESDKTVIITNKQEQGKGLGSNKWESEEYKNLTFSVVFRHQNFLASEQFNISMVIALACYDFIASKTNKIVSVKWPNDLYVGDMKIGGILIENIVYGNKIRYSICGVGLNINQSAFVSDAPNPISLNILENREYDLQECLQILLNCIDERLSGIKDYDMLKKSFISVMYRSNGVFYWKDATSEFKASISGIDEYGRLVLLDADGNKRIYSFKEVEYLYGK